MIPKVRTLPVQPTKESLLSAADAVQRRNTLERGLDKTLGAFAQEFVEGVLADAQDALLSPALVAAGQARDSRGRYVGDPFSYTRVMERWYQGLRDLAGMPIVEGTSVREVLADSSLPSMLHEEVVDLLLRARSEDWTEYQTKRHLSRLLIPKQGSDEERKSYRNRIRRLSRTQATSGYGRWAQEQFAAAGIPFKSWVARHDDRTRSSHMSADGQVVALDQKFLVGGSLMMYPGDETAPIEETANCRCVIRGSYGSSD